MKTTATPHPTPATPHQTSRPNHRAHRTPKPHQPTTARCDDHYCQCGHARTSHHELGCMTIIQWESDTLWHCCPCKKYRKTP